ncbi:hypothetical protein HKCCE3408_08895 [Rhodobacterales bacterium HKCCE3408]|nr:hypothetical protein [Rhodobacterales bacterium HKCCE3408]
MIRGIIVAVSGLAVLSACGLRDPQQAPVLSIVDGTYDASVGGGCAVLEFGRRDRVDYLFDAECDGVAETTTGEVEIVEDEIVVPGAVIEVNSVGATSFSGVWRQGDSALPVQFTMRAEES